MTSENVARFSRARIRSRSARPDGAQSRRLRLRQICRYRPGEVIYREGDVAKRLYTVRRGIVKLIRHLPNGRARIVRLHARGSMLGLPPGAAEVVTHPDTAVALGSVELESLPYDYFNRVCRDEPASWRRLCDALCEQVRQADLWITEFSTGSIESRMARLIGFLSSIEEDVPDGEVELLTCQDMGEILGVTPESVSRTVAAWKRRGMLEPAGARATERFACDVAALERLAHR